jgi:hypothetical protein
MTEDQLYQYYKLNLISLTIKFPMLITTVSMILNVGLVAILLPMYL